MIYRLTLRGAPFHLFISHFIIPKCSPLCAETEFNVLLCCCHVFCALLYPFIIPRFFCISTFSCCCLQKSYNRNELRTDTASLLQRVLVRWCLMSLYRTKGHKAHKEPRDRVYVHFAKQREISFGTRQY